MSGIAAIIHFDGRPALESELRRMTTAMSFRGPDGVRHVVSGHAALGHCALNSTPESMREVQPVLDDEAGLLLVLDGRIDNFSEIRDDLSNDFHRGRLQTDADLVLAAYRRWGKQCACRFEGDFAFVIWDAKQQEAFCARDIAGNKPLHYHWSGSTLTIASDVQAVRQLPWTAGPVNEGMLTQYFVGDWSTLDQTLWRDILRLPPAHTLTVQGGKCLLDRYWAPDLFAAIRYHTDDEYAEHYLHLLERSIAQASRSHRPVAFEVSGGLDSSALFAVATKLQRSGNFLAPGKKGYTLDFGWNPEANELEYVHALAAHLDEHIDLVPPWLGPLNWYRDIAAQSGDMPSFPNGAMSLNLHQKSSADGARVLVSGTGGDEWLSGGSSYLAEAFSAGAARIHESVTAEMRVYGPLRGTWHLLRFGLLPQLPPRCRRFIRRADGKLRQRGRPFQWLTPGKASMAGELSCQQADFLSWPHGRPGHVGQLQRLYSPFIQMAREITERFVASRELDWRQPFWNKKLIEFSFAIPEFMRTRGGINKWLHRRSIEGLVPGAIAKRQSKAGFDITFAHVWPEVEDHFRQRLLPRWSDWLEPAEVNKLLAQARQPNRAGWPEGIVWGILCADAALNQRVAQIRGLL